jgi:hypothetical protein
MSNFNQYFRNTGAKIIVDRFFNKVDAYNPKVKVGKIGYPTINQVLF